MRKVNPYLIVLAVLCVTKCSAQRQVKLYHLYAGEWIDLTARKRKIDTLPAKELPVLSSGWIYDDAAMVPVHHKLLTSSRPAFSFSISSDSSFALNYDYTTHTGHYKSLKANGVTVDASYYNIFRRVKITEERSFQWAEDKDKSIPIDSEWWYVTTYIDNKYKYSFDCMADTFIKGNYFDYLLYHWRDATRDEILEKRKKHPGNWSITNQY